MSAPQSALARAAPLGHQRVPKRLHRAASLGVEQHRPDPRGRDPREGQGDVQAQGDYQEETPRERSW